MNNTTKIELAISDLAEALALSIELKLAKRFGETIGRVNDRLAKVEERLEDLDSTPSDIEDQTTALEIALDDHEARLHEVEDQLCSGLTQDDVREMVRDIWENSEIKIKFD